MPDENKFTVKAYTTETVPMHDGAFHAINAFVEARNPTGQNFILYAGCEFLEDEKIFATTVTKTVVGARQVKIFKLNTPVIGPLVGRTKINIHCRYETKRANTSPRK